VVVRFLDFRQEVFRFPWLENVTENSGTDRLDHFLCLGIAGKQDGYYVGIFLFDSQQEIRPLHLRHF